MADCGPSAFGAPALNSGHSFGDPPGVRFRPIVDIRKESNLTIVAMPKVRAKRLLGGTKS